MHGAGHEYGLRPGTENVPYIVALGAAATLAAKSVDREADRLSKLRDLMFDSLREEIGNSLTANGAKAERLPNTLSVNFPNVVGAELLARIPELCAATGAACHSGQTSMSSTLNAIGLPADVAKGTLRLSCGWYTSEEEVQRAVSLLIGAWEAEG
jgi:cysteine desulfurase